MIGRSLLNLRQRLFEATLSLSYFPFSFTGPATLVYFATLSFPFCNRLQSAQLNTVQITQRNNVQKEGNTVMYVTIMIGKESTLLSFTTDTATEGQHTVCRQIEVGN